MSRSRVNIYSVAEQARVSIATVSRVQRGADAVAPATRERVLRTIEDLGYRPNGSGRALAERRHAATGIVFPDLSGPYYAEVLQGFEDEVIAQGQSLLILGTHGRPNCEELVQDLAGRVDGLLVMARTISDAAIGALERNGIPVVLLGRPPVNGTPAVRSENVKSATALTHHVLAHGYERVAFLGAPGSTPDVEERWHGFLEAHRQAGLPLPERPIGSGLRQEDGFRAALHALRDERPDLLVCANDELALGAYRAAQELGKRVPEEIAVTGWDDIQLARFLAPPLTTVRQPMRELGVRAARLLFERMAGTRAGAPGSVRLSTEMVVRASCGCRQETKQGPKEASR